MGNDFLTNLSTRMLEINSFDKRTVFSIATTSKQEEIPYLTPVRVCKDFVLSGCVIFDQKILPMLLKEIDGAVDIILVDSEKKIPFHIYDDIENEKNLEQTVGCVETGTISKTCFQHLSISKVFEFKPNDLTVNAAWTFLSHRLNFLSGKRISILGAGNIGSKLALKLVECGAEVHIYRRDSYKGYQISHGLNLIKPEGVIATVQFHENILKTTFMSDVLIGATNGHPVIDKDVVRSVKKNCLIVELGKNNFTKDGLESAVTNSIEIYRTDISPAIESYVYEVLKMQDISQHTRRRCSGVAKNVLAVGSGC